MEYNNHVGMTFEECCKHHARIVDKVVNKNIFRVSNCGTFGKEDLKQIALEGMMKAYQQFKSNYKTQFQYYAYDMMKWEILNTLKINRSTVHFPQSFCIIWSVASKCETKNIDKLMNYTPKRISREQVERAMEWYGYDSTISLDKPIENIKGTKKSCYDSIIGSENDETIVEVKEFLSTLTQKQCNVVVMLMEEMSQMEIAKELGISQAQVSRIVKSIQKAWLEYSGDVEW